MYICCCFNAGKTQQLSRKEDKVKKIRMQALRPRRGCGFLQNDSVAIKAATRFKSKYPSFMVLMTKSYITKGPMVCLFTLEAKITIDHIRFIT